jgi:beta-glucosidase
MIPTLSRRHVLAAGLAAASVPTLAAPATGGRQRFPKGFLWGAATSAYQMEGNNVGSDIWLLEHTNPTNFKDKSGDACDHYNRFDDDIRLLAGLGLNTYRFSVEWSRIEPAPGEFSRAEIEHYRRVLIACHTHNVVPMMTLNHFTTPRWFAAAGGWEQKDAVPIFLRFTRQVAAGLGDLLSYATTFNEPNLSKLLRWVMGPADKSPEAKAMIMEAARSCGSDRFGTERYGDLQKIQDAMLAAHIGAVEVMKSGPGKYPVGMNLAVADDQPIVADSRVAEIQADVNLPWLQAAAKDDFIGVQAYTRSRVDKNGYLPPPDGAEITQMHYEYYPESLEGAIRYTAKHLKIPIYITENGVGTKDDTRRVEFLRRALPGMLACIKDGIDVRGYMHWSLLDNFEWELGYDCTFGLVAVDRVTQKRTPKPSAHYYGDIARRNAI